MSDTAKPTQPSAASATRLQPPSLSKLPPKPAPKPAPAVASAPKAPSRMQLSKVTRGRLQKPVRVLIYGIEGVGKSTFAAGAPEPIFLGNEDGTSQLDVARFPEPHSWVEMMEAVTELTNTDHNYKTLAIDTLDWAEPLCWVHTCEKGGTDKRGKKFQHIEDFGYGKGFNKALEHWRLLVVALERMRAAREMNIVLIAHSWIKTFKNPGGEDFDRYEMKLHKAAGGLLREWCDDVLFATHATWTYETEGGRVKGISNGARVVHTQRTAAWDAKNRHDLPEELPLDWEAYAEAVAAHRPADPAVLLERIEQLLKRTDDDRLIERVNSDVAKADGDAAMLARIENKLSARLGEQTKEEEAAQ